MSGFDFDIDVGGNSGFGSGGRKKRQNQVATVDQEDLARRLKIVTKLIPSLKKDPESALALAQLPFDDDELVGAVARTVGFSQTESLGKTLKKATDEEQRAAWETFDKTQRRLLKQSGYGGPPKEEEGDFFDAVVGVGEAALDLNPMTAVPKAIIEGKSIEEVGAAAIPGGSLGLDAISVAAGEKEPLELVTGQIGRMTGLSLFNDARERVDKTTGAVADLLGKTPGVGSGFKFATGALSDTSDFLIDDVAGGGLQLLDTVGRSPSHLYRTVGALAHDPDVDDFFDAWEKTGVAGGEGYFKPEAREDALDVLDGNRQHLRWAEAIAAGKTTEDIAGRAGPLGSREYQNRYLEIYGMQAASPFLSAVNTLEMGKDSPGRDTALQFGLDLDSTEGKLVSGLFDGAFTMGMDPLLAAGKLRKGWMLSKYGIDAGNLAASVTARQSDEIARLVKTGGNDLGATVFRSDASVDELLRFEQQAVRSNARTSALAARIVRGFKEWGDSGRALWDPAAPLARLVRENPRMAPAMDELIALDRRLAEGGLEGIRKIDDVWDFYRTGDGLKSMSSGHWGGSNIEHFQLPGISRTNYALAKAKGVANRTIESLANNRLAEVLDVGPGQVVNKAGEVVAATDELPDLADDHVRLFRVQSGPGLEGARDTVPSYVRDVAFEASDDSPAHLKLIANTKLHGHWFTDDLEVARAAASDAGPTGRLWYVDVPHESESIIGLPELAGLSPVSESFVGKAIDADREFLLVNPESFGPAQAGAVGDFVTTSGGPKSTVGRALLAPPSRFWLSLSRQIPTKNIVPLHGEQFPKLMEQFLDMGLAGAAKDMYMNALLAAENPAARRTVLRSAMDRVFYVNGTYSSPEGRELAERYLNGLNQQYADGSLDVMVGGTEAFRNGILPVADHADGIAIPSFRDILETSQGVGVMRSLFGGINNSMVDAFMGRYWKPAVLLRLGFIPRAAGEELLSTVLRMPHLLANHTLWIPLAKKEGQPLWMFQKIADAAEYMQSLLPDAVAGGTAPWTEKLAHFLISDASAAVRGHASQFADPNMLGYSRALAKSAVGQRIASEAVTEVSGVHNIYGTDELADIPGRTIEIALDAGATKTARLVESGSKFETYPIEDFKARGFYSHQVGRFVGSSGGSEEVVGRAVADAASIHVSRSQANEVQGVVARVLGGGDDGSQAFLSLDWLDADGPQGVLRGVRAAYGGASDATKNAAHEYLRAVGRHGKSADEATRALDALNLAAQAETSDGVRALARILPEVSPGTGFAMLVDEGKIVSRLGESSLAHLPFDAGLLDAPAPNARRVFWADSTDPVDMGVLRADAAAAEGAEQAIPFTIGYRDPSSAWSAGGAPGRELVYVDVDMDALDPELRILFDSSNVGAVPVPVRMVGSPSIVPPATVDPRASRWRELVDRSRDGDDLARDELIREVALRELQHPDMAQYVRESVRGAQDRNGSRVVNAVPEGQQPVYSIVVPPRLADSVADAMFLHSPSPTAQRLLDARIGGEMQRAQDLEAIGHAGPVPLSTWSTTDHTEAAQIRDEINRALGGVGEAADSRAEVGVAMVDEARFAEFRRSGQVADDYEYLLTDTDQTRLIPLASGTPTVTAGRAGKAYQVPGISLEDALRDWSDVLAERSKQLFISPRDGRVLHEVAVPATHKGHYNRLDLADFDPGDELPKQVTGPGLFLDDEGLWERGVRFGFDSVINPAISAIARKPLFFHNASKRFASAQHLRQFYEDSDLVADAVRIADVATEGRMTDLRQVWDGLSPELKAARSWRTAEAQNAMLEAGIPRAFRELDTEQIEVLRGWANNQDMVDHQIFTTAFHGAVADTTPFIDDHRVRSQFAEGMRNLIPFWFAEEQFLKRWARSFAHSPELIRRAQLYAAGLHTVGILRQNAEGEDVFVIPGSQLLADLVGEVGELVTGEEFSVPVEIPLTGQTKFTLPGFNRVGVPAFSPLVGVPLALLTQRFPELEGFQNDVMGEQAVGRSIFDQLLPASISRFFPVFSGAEGNQQYASAMIQSMQYLDAHGHTPAADATAADREHYLERVENHTRALLAAKAIFGFVSPAPPVPEYPGDELNKEFRDLLKSVPLEDAMGAFLEQHPDANAYTIFQTKSKSGASMATTKAVGDFLTGNREFVDRYPLAASWMLPQSDSSDAGERYVFNLQMRMELRESKSPQAWLEDLYFSKAADKYFSARDAYNGARESVPDPDNRSAMDDAWRKWKNSYFKANPLFAEQLQTREAHQRRVKVIDELQAAFSDPETPADDVPHYEALRTMVQSYRTFKNNMDALTNDRTEQARKKRQFFRSSFYAWGKGFTGDNPGVLAFWQRNLVPEIGFDGGDQALLDEALD